MRKASNKNSLGFSYCFSCRSFACRSLASLSRSLIFYILMGCRKCSPSVQKNLKLLQTGSQTDRSLQKDGITIHENTELTKRSPAFTEISVLLSSQKMFQHYFNFLLQQITNHSKQLPRQKARRIVRYV